MNQSFDMQLQVVQRALSEIVLPALGNAEKHVVEQLHLSMAALAFMRARLPMARGFFRAELSGYMDLAGVVRTLLEGHGAETPADLGQLVQAGQAELDRPAAEIEDYQAITRQLREAITGLTTREVDQPYEAALDALIVERSVDQHAQDRFWCLPLGFELRPETLAVPDWAST